MSDATTDAGPLVWRRVRAGLYEADAGRFGRFVIERRPNGRWYVSSPGIGFAPTGSRSFRVARAKTGRCLVVAVADAPRTLLEWGVAILYRGHETNTADLYEHAICCPDDPYWFAAAGITRSQLDGGTRHFWAGPTCLALRRIWGSAWSCQDSPPQAVALARDCIADPRFLPVLADAAQDAGRPELEQAARHVAAAIEEHRTRKGG